MILRSIFFVCLGLVPFLGSFSLFYSAIVRAGVGIGQFELFGALRRNLSTRAIVLNVIVGCGVQYKLALYCLLRPIHQGVCSGHGHEVTAGERSQGWVRGCSVDLDSLFIGLPCNTYQVRASLLLLGPVLFYL
ncbi:uncharacterized protein LOC141656996 [Silene latifolia]|uniref:uncharacterized protein LOC141656996 n=1 Tax=Silene latifolia TaxID=37657 RepID=UPI003D77DE7A